MENLPNQGEKEMHYAQTQSDSVGLTPTKTTKPDENKRMGKYNR